jgi:hypothetical protein
MPGDRGLLPREERVRVPGGEGRLRRKRLPPLAGRRVGLRADELRVVVRLLNPGGVFCVDISLSAERRVLGVDGNTIVLLTLLMFDGKLDVVVVKGEEE